MFVDKVKVFVKAGDGGNGIVSFRHEKSISRGGPDGGDGGNGGDVVLLSSNNQNTLAAFRYQRRLDAEAGQAGSKRKKHGKSGKELVVAVPVGTAVYDVDGNLLADLTRDGQREIIALGGKGGFGNAHFTSSTRQAPRLAEKGEPGQELEATLELKMIADVGLVGLPNAGKSTLLARVSNAKPEIASYPFTTLTPNLGVVDIDDGTSLLFADIPGLIEGASEGKGLGTEFLRHIERTAVLIHLIDAYHEDVASAYQTIQNELKTYHIDLSKRAQIVALNKIDGLDEEMIMAKEAELKKVVPKNTLVFAISAQSGAGIKDLLYSAKALVLKERARKAAKKAQKAELPVIRLAASDDDWEVKETKDGYVVIGAKIESFARRTDFTSSHGKERLRDIMRKMGITRELSRHGIEAGQKITIGDPVVGKLEY